jgi:carboxymethylenebutenolidase
MADLLKAMRADPRSNGKVAMLGVCFGGLYAYLGVSRLGANAAGAYHGTKIGEYLGEVDKVTAPVSFHYGKNDPIVPLDEVAAVQKAFAGRANADVTLHEGATHNFSMAKKDGYHPEVAKKSRDAVLKAFRAM